jgi:uncharacterized protein
VHFPLFSHVTGEGVNNMRSWRVVETKGKNKYFYDRNVKRVHLCHPLLYYIMDLSSRGVDIIAWLNQMEEGTVEVDGYGPVTKSELGYYVRKYLIFKKNGYFNDGPGQDMPEGQFCGNAVKNTLANVKQVTFEVTENCNLDCAYCGYGKFYNYHGGRVNRDLAPDTAKTLLDYLLELWNSPLNRSHDRAIYISFYGGEPLLNFRFIARMVDYVKQLGTLHNRFVFSITTNGLLLRKYMDFLYENRFDILISLDGNEGNNAYRVFKGGKPAYPIILEQVVAFQQKYPDYFAKRVNFNAVLHNKNSVSDIYHFFKTRFNKIPAISMLSAHDIRESQKEQFRGTYANFNESLYGGEDYAMIERDMFIRVPGVQDVMIFLHRCTDFCFDDYNGLIYPNRVRTRIPTGTCAPFSKKIFLAADGKVLPCERVGKQHELGEVGPGRVDINASRIAKKYNDYFARIKKKCGDCYQLETCEQCIFHLNLEEQESSCDGFMAQTDHELYLSSILSYIEENPAVHSRILKEVNVD